MISKKGKNPAIYLLEETNFPCSASILEPLNSTPCCLRRLIRISIKIQKKFRVSYEPANEILVLDALSSSVSLGEPAQIFRLARAFTAHIHKVGIEMKTRHQNLNLKPCWICQQ